MNFNKRKLAFKITLIVISIIFLVILCVAIAYIADFAIYNNTTQDGKLLSYAARTHGILNIW
ncbi:hypothetical protein [Mycoplasmopsis sturni]|uniref:hypothetical protein n=1 Tax=Mycoplasmopsis sturni TaxID=39047 RepID=UPI000560ED28|nr:hypothetical protein [Mycoplasmopsis sturni]